MTVFLYGEGSLTGGYTARGAINRKGLRDGIEGKLGEERNTR